MRNPYVGLALTTAGIALALAGAVPHSPLAVSQYVAITLIAAGATLLAIGSLAEIYLRGLVLKARASRVGELTGAASRHLDALARETSAGENPAWDI